MSYETYTENWSGIEAITLKGPAGAKATILPSFGANLIRMELPGADGEVISLVDTPKDLATLQSRPTRYGAPVLFPFPGRVANSTYDYAGSTYELDEPADGGPARHGFVLKGTFSPVDSGCNDKSAWVTLLFSGDTPDIRRQYPSTFRFFLNFRLAAEQLSLHVRAENTGEKNIPVGFGWHPYFRMPLTERGKRGSCRLHVTCSETWQLSSELVPTGKKIPIPADLDLRYSPRVGEREFDNVLTTPQQGSGGWSHAELIDEASGLKVSIGAGPSFSEWVVFTPPQREVVCLEPYTCPGNAFNLHAAGVKAGVIDLKPGGNWEDHIDVRLEKL